MERETLDSTKVSDTKAVVDWHRRLKAEDDATNALHALAMLEELLVVAADSSDGIVLTSRATRGIVMTLCRAEGEILALLETLKAEREATSEV